MKPQSDNPTDERDRLRRAATETFIGKLKVELKELEEKVMKLGYQRVIDDFERQKEMPGLEASRIMANLKGVMGDRSVSHVYEHPVRVEDEPVVEYSETDIETVGRLLGEPLTGPENGQP